MAIDRSEVFDIIMNSCSIDEIMDRVDDLDDVQMIHCKDCGAIFTSDLSQDECYECSSSNIETVGMDWSIGTNEDEEAEWIESDISESNLSMCSACGFSTGCVAFKYCPMCRRKMTNSI